jgi:hypothetical protein
VARRWVRTRALLLMAYVVEAGQLHIAYCIQRIHFTLAHRGLHTTVQRWS